MEKINRETSTKPCAKQTRKVLRRFSVLAFLFGVGLALPAMAHAASLSLSPLAGSYENGQVFTVNVTVTSNDVAVNAISGVISFPQEKIEITSLSRTGSLIGLWAQEPSFSNTVGTVNFEGIIMNPGFQGAGGKVLAITFRVKAAGSAIVAFASGSVLANDGLGTNVLQNFGNAEFGLKVASQDLQAGEGMTPTSILGTPLAPAISSPTHPNPDSWYSNNNPKFLWNVPTGVTAVRILYDRSSRSIPTVTYAPPIAEKTLSKISDGTWYFHVQFRDANGWGSISHFRFQIDTIPPQKFKISFMGDSIISNPRPVVFFDTVDELSGIDFYKVKVGDQDFFRINEEEVTSNPYTLPPQEAGKHSILVQAFDRAGNYETAVADFNVESIATPTFTDYPPAVNEGNPFVVEGITLSSAKVSVWLQREGSLPKRYGVLANKEGEFTVVVEGDLKAGQYQFWGEVEDERGAKSSPTDKLSFTVSQQPVLRIGSFVMNVLALAVSVVALVVLGCVLFWYWRRRLRSFRRVFRKEVHDIERSVHQAFESLKKDVQTHIRTLEKEGERRVLSRDEEKILDQLRKNLDKAEELIEKEVKDVEEKVK